MSKAVKDFSGGAREHEQAVRLLGLGVVSEDGPTITTISLSPRATLDEAEWRINRRRRRCGSFVYLIPNPSDQNLCCGLSLRAQRSNLVEQCALGSGRDCFVASLLAMTG